MAKSTTERDDKPDSSDKAPRKRPSKPQSGQPGRKFDIVEQAGKESFPASDAPCWNP